MQQQDLANTGLDSTKSARHATNPNVVPLKRPIFLFFTVHGEVKIARIFLACCPCRAIASPGHDAVRIMG
jgi:hypothetical protein